MNQAPTIVTTTFTRHDIEKAESMARKALGQDTEHLTAALHFAGKLATATGQTLTDMAAIITKLSRQQPHTARRKPLIHNGRKYKR